MGMKKKRAGLKEHVVPATPAASKSQVRSSTNEIDAIFGKKKRKQVVPDEPQVIPAVVKKKITKSRASPGVVKKTRAGKGEVAVSSIGISSSPPPAKSKRKTADGLTIYGEDELKWNSKTAGGTRLCPFDCDCCF